MSGYARPTVTEQVFRDADGAVIDYGNRWGGSPPEDTYSVGSNLERFAPLHRVAEALVDHLTTTYDVAVVDDPSVAADVDLPAGDGVVRAVRLTPRAADTAALTVVLTGDPGVHVHAGLLHDFRYPACGCDACDATWESEADGLEHLLLGVAEGRYGERVTRWPRPWVYHALGDRDGRVTDSGGQVASRIPRRGRRAARSTLRRLGRGPWRPWPRRP